MQMREIALIGFARNLFIPLMIASKRKKEIKDYFIVVFCVSWSRSYLQMSN